MTKKLNDWPGGTTVEEHLRLDVRRRSTGEIVRTLIALLDRQQRGWRMVAIEVTIERPVPARERGAPRSVKGSAPHKE